jgi:hypothetical protein
VGTVGLFQRTESKREEVRIFCLPVLSFASVTYLVFMRRTSNKIDDELFISLSHGHGAVSRCFLLHSVAARCKSIEYHS